MPALRRNDSLFTNGWTGVKPCHVTTDTGASVNITRPDIATGLPKRKPSWPWILSQCEDRPSVSWRRPAVYCAEEHTMDLDVQWKDHRRIYPRAGHPVSLHGGSKFETSCAMTGQRRSVIMASLDMTMTGNDVIPVRCGRDLTVWPKGPMEVVNSWVGPSL